MKQVITSKEAREITGGRLPLVPVEYEEAMKSLEACITLDESKYWDDKADALAAWAKIYRDRDLTLKAKRLKLHAYRRMGQLAMALRPRHKQEGFGPRALGAVSALREAGLTQAQANTASYIGKMPEEKFQEYVRKPIPPAPASILSRHSVNTSEMWKEIRDSHRNPFNCSVFLGKHDPETVARSLTPSEAHMARNLLLDLIDWCDRCEQALPKFPDDSKFRRPKTQNNLGPASPTGDINAEQKT